MAEKRVSVRLAATGGRQVKAELEGVGEAGKRGFGRLSREMEEANRRLDPERVGHGKGRTHVPAEHGAGDRPELTAEAQSKVPDLPAIERDGPVQPPRAVRARRRAGLAVAVAPAEVPFGEGAKAFFSCSSTRPFAT